MIEINNNYNNIDYFIEVGNINIDVSNESLEIEIIQNNCLEIETIQNEFQFELLDILNIEIDIEQEVPTYKIIELELINQSISIELINQAIEINLL